VTKSIFIKSATRQPIRHLILAILVGAAAFSFVLRATEFIVVQREMTRLESFYRPIGFVVDINAPLYYPSEIPVHNWLNWRDTRWVEVIASNPYVHFMDIRRPIAAELDGILSPDIISAGLNYGAPLGRNYSADAYFFGTLTEIRYVDNPVDIYGVPHVNLMFDINDVIIGFAEHLEEGGVMRFVVPATVVDDIEEGTLEIGNRYLLRGVYSPVVLHVGLRFFTSIHEHWYPYISLHPAAFRDRLIDFPHIFNTNIDPPMAYSLLARPLIEGGDMYFLPADSPSLNTVLYEMQEQISLLERNMQTILVFPTHNMHDMPFYFRHTPRTGYVAGLRPAHGRLVDYQDSVDANPVIVVNSIFAATRGVEIGDTISVTLRENAPLLLPSSDVTVEEYESWFSSTIAAGRWQPFNRSLPHNHADWQDFRTLELELEVVGIYQLTGDASQDYGRHNFLIYYGTYAYIPAGLIPDDWGRMIHWTFHDSQFSFVLTSARQLDAFINQTENVLLELGYTLHFITHPGAQMFIDAVDSIGRTLAFNLAAFTVVSVIALLLASFAYVLLMRKNFTIARTLGSTSSQTIVGVLTPALSLWLTFIALGSIMAWNVALTTAEGILAGLYDSDVVAVAHQAPSLVWLVIYILAILFAIFVLTGGSFINLSRRPLLQLIQSK